MSNLCWRYLTEVFIGMNESWFHPQLFRFRKEILIALHHFPSIRSTSRVLCFSNMHQHEANRHKPSGFCSKNGIEVGGSGTGIVGRVDTNFFDFVHEGGDLLMNKPDQMRARLCIENDSCVLRISTSRWYTLTLGSPLKACCIFTHGSSDILPASSRNFRHQYRT